MSWYKPWTWGDESESAINKRKQLESEGESASGFAGQGQSGYQAMTDEARGARGYLRDIAEGRLSLSGEQLRQGLGQNLAAQRSFAASAAPSSAPMAARTAAANMGRIGAGMAGQAAMAGIAERQAAAKQLADSILAQRAQDVQVGLGSRQNAISAYGGVTPEGSFIDKWGAPIAAAAGIYAGRK